MSKNNQTQAANMAHPMDDFPVRGLDFDLSQLGENGFLWKPATTPTNKLLRG